MDKNVIAKNTFSSLFNQTISIICGFILPRLFLVYYGSAVNGLISSITQFLSFVTFLEMGIGAVVQSNLYKPLAAHDKDLLSRIMKSARKFYRTVAYAFSGYIVLVCAFYPFTVKGSFGIAFSVALIVIISISTFMQYYFGIVNQILLHADQKAYIPLTLQSVTLALNTVLCYFLMDLGCSIQIVKLGTSFIYLLRPLGMFLYVKKHYHIDYSADMKDEPIEQKWNGLAQHIAAMVLEHTDVVVLTLCSTLESVSIYTVYYNVVCGVRRIFSTVIDSVRASFGRLVVQNEKEILLDKFRKMEYMIHFLLATVFSSTISLIIPFVKVYTKGIEDADYILPVFGVIITCAYLMYCLRCFYNMPVLAAGHYKETQAASFMEAVINIIISVICVNTYGLVGVAIGTFCAMFYRVVYIIWYLSRNILQRPMIQAYRHLTTDSIAILVSCIISNLFVLEDVSYFSWVVLAVKVLGISTVTSLLVHLCFYHRATVYFIRMLWGWLCRGKRHEKKDK